MPIRNRPKSVHAEAGWRRIVSRSGAIFNQDRGRPFTYEARRRTIYRHTTNWVIGRAAVEQALICMPLDRVSDLQDLSAPSYLYAILTDDRIAASTTDDGDVRPRNEPCR